MPKITIIYAVLLILIGFIGYLGSGMVSITALIPAFFGVVVLVIGLLGLSEKRRKAAMHIASALGLSRSQKLCSMQITSQKLL